MRQTVKRLFCKPYEHFPLILYSSYPFLGAINSPRFSLANTLKHLHFDKRNMKFGRPVDLFQQTAEILEIIQYNCPCI